jgi:CBS-domain-containing membrane protein
MGLEASRTSHIEKLLATVGGFARILLVAQLSQYFVAGSGAALVVASAGASTVLLFAVPHGALSQRWPVFGGHMVSATVGVVCAQWIPDPLFAGPWPWPWLSGVCTTCAASTRLVGPRR